MNYWHMQLHPDDRKEVNREEVLKIIREKEIIGLGKEWDNDRGQPHKFSNEMKVGDIVLVRSDGPLALVKVISTCDDNVDDEVWFELKRRIKIISLEGDKYKKEFKKKFNASWNESMYLPTTIELANISRFINYWYYTIKMKEEMQNLRSILSYKNQIILQGPPGTGKTRLAKMLAFELTKSETKLSPVDYVDWYIKNFKSSKKTRDRNLYQTNLLKEFTEEFPLETLKKMSLDQYCLGKGSTTSFCYWIEVGLKDLGRFSPGLAGTTVYGVYYSKEDKAYKSTAKTPDELLKDIQIALSELIEKEDYTKARALFRFSFILKILNSYFPEKYFPIVSKEHLKSIAAIFNISPKGLNDIEINKKINDAFYRLKTNNSSDILSSDLMAHLYNKFKIKENQFDEVLIDVVDELGETKLIQFHPAYSYEDFVRGITVETNEKSQIEYKVVNKTLADFAQKALENPTANYVLIIDEINRANLPSVLGELIYALEYRYDKEKQNLKEASVESMYSLKQNEKDLTGDNSLMLPTNLFIIGTMNTADRSVGHIDYAIRRRFAFVDVLPTDTAIDDVVTEPILNKKAKDLYQKVARLFNEDKLNTIYLQSDFKAKEVQLGHSYFLVETDKQLQLKLEFEIKPLLNEYVKDGILSESALAVIDTL